MCGIAGWWESGPGLGGGAVLDRMLDTLAHRGPDGRGTWIDGPVALGHVRLAVIDPAARGDQPFVSGDGMGVLTYNGEVYNAPDLRRELEREGVRFVSRTDTEVVLEALHRWGPDAALPRLDGMFAFAYLDRRSQTLWLARDRVGIKPLYVTASAGLRIAFASEAKALLARPDVPARPDLDVVAQYLTEGYLRGPRSPLQGIREVAPGTCLRVTGDGTETRRYFNLRDALDVERLLAGDARSDSDWIAEFEALTRASVDAHLASDVPLAALCSGGVDSSLVTALARERMPGLTAYVADVEGAPLEGECARAVASHLRLPLTSVRVTTHELLGSWPRATWLLDEPSFHPSVSAILVAASACRADGIKVVLTGEGADEMFAGYGFYGATRRIWRRWRRRRRLWSWWPGMPPRPRPTRGMFGNFDLPIDGVPCWPRFPEDLGREREDLLASLLDALAPVGPLEDRAFLAHCMADLHGILRAPLQRMDRMGMGASVETRVPFLESRLIDAAMHMPLRLKRRGRVRKWVVKAVAETRLPAGIVHARKRGLPVPDRHFDGTERLLHGGVVADLLRWTARDMNAVIAVCAAEPRVRHDLVGLELWARIFLRGEDPADLAGELLAMSADHARELPAARRRAPREPVEA